MSVLTSSTTGRSASSARRNAAREILRPLDADAHGAHVLGDLGEIDLGEGPELARLLGRVAAIGAVEAALRLVAAVIVVDHRHRVDLPPHRGLDLADMVPEAAIAGEDDNRPVGRAALGAEPRREGPAEMAGAADIALGGLAQIVEPAHPHAGVSGIDHGDAVLRHETRELAADALGPDRPGVRLQERPVFLVPFGARARGCARATARAAPRTWHRPHRASAPRSPWRRRGSPPRAGSCGPAPPARCRSGSPSRRSSAPPRNASSCRLSRCR